MKRVLPITYCLPLSTDNEYLRKAMLHEAAATGIKHIVLGENIVAQTVKTPLFASVVQAELSAEGLDFVDSHAPFGVAVDMNMPDPLGINSLRHKLHLQIAGDMNVKSMVIHIGNSHTCIGESTETQLDRIYSMLEKILPTAEQCDVVVCIENIWSELNIPENLWKIKKHFDTPYLGFCYDSGHANLMDKARDLKGGYARDLWAKCNASEPRWDDQILEKLLPEIVCCHLHDNGALTDAHARPGKGLLDWNKIVPLLKEAPRLQAIQSEVSIIRDAIGCQKLSECFNNLFNTTTGEVICE